MHNVWLIAKREYMERVTTKGFLIMTILIPLLMGGGLLLSAKLSSKSKSSARIVIVTRDMQLGLDLQRDLENGKEADMTVNVISPPQPGTRAELMHDIGSNSIDGFLWIDSPSGQYGAPKMTYTSASAADISTTSALESAMRRVLTRERLMHQGMVSQEADAMMQPVKIGSEIMKDGATNKSDAKASFMGVYALFFLMYMAVMLYGMNVARSIIEEKTSRVFEVLLATIRPQEMMAGKLLGVGSVGLTQLGIWVAAMVLLTKTSLAAAALGSDGSVALTAGQLAFFLLYFVLGFMFYSAIAAALGAMCNSEQELQQLNMFMAMPMAACFFMLWPVVSNSNSAFSTVASLIPFFTPLIMFLRISLKMPPTWQILLSVIDMALSIYVLTWIAARIYRIGILMYGKRPTLPEIIRWLKYS
ncbi:MAG: ABC transporter permease [Acidobacteriaceae bacterium]